MQFNLSEILEFDNEYLNDKSGLIPLLQRTQVKNGYVPEGAFFAISKHLNIPVSDIYGVATFYAQFRLKPLGKNICKVCDGTACHVNGAETIYNDFFDALGLADGEDTTKDGSYTLEKVACVGCCSLAPVVVMNDETHGRLTQKAVKKLIKGLKS